MEKIKVTFANPQLAKNPAHKSVMDNFSTFVNLALVSIKDEVIRQGAYVEHQEDSASPTGFQLRVVTPNQRLKQIMIEKINEFIAQGRHS
jgi:hypothetical protein